MKLGKLRLALILSAAFVVFVFLNNVSWFGDDRGDGADPWILAHRGLGQTFDLEGVDNDTCTAERIHRPRHSYLENTLPSTRAAFDTGARVVELDVHLTKDDRFAVFHDWELDCRTEGTGVTRDHTLAALQRLDIGHGYTADSGRTYPFRGKGIGLMPSLDQVLARFDDRELLLHIKSNDPEEGVRLAQRLERLPAARRDRLAVYGGDEPIAALRQRMPGLRTMSKATMTSCLGQYVALGWSGYVPDACRHTQVHLPEKIAPWLWGWPGKFVDRMESVDTRVVLVAGDGDVCSGFDSAADLRRLLDGYRGGVWTNRVDVVAELLPEES
ncbi:MAG TPA: glycerophosphodiester phosphodiesterase family protein [Actinopolymorphaceae bacterium]